jgi:hypothetical protein
MLPASLVVGGAACYIYFGLLNTIKGGMRRENTLINSPEVKLKNK